MPWSYLCDFCGGVLTFRRPLPSGQSVYCGIECLIGSESSLRDRVNAIRLREEQ